MKIEKHHTDPVLVGIAHEVEIHLWVRYIWANHNITFVLTLHPDEARGVKRED